MKIVKGDAVYPVGSGVKIICHVCNNIGLWGKGFVLSLSKRWPHARDQYLDLFRTGFLARGLPGGQVYTFTVDHGILVANMIAQDGVASSYNRRPLVMDWLDECLVNLRYYHFNDSIHMPKIGSGLAGGNWDDILALIEKRLGDRDVTIYEKD